MGPGGKVSNLRGGEGRGGEGRGEEGRRWGVEYGDVLFDLDGAHAGWVGR
jgi:hypothetical protein